MGCILTYALHLLELRIITLSGNLCVWLDGLLKFPDVQKTLEALSKVYTLNFANKFMTLLHNPAVQLC